MKITIYLAKSGGNWSKDYWYPVDADLLFDLAPQYANVATFAVHRSDNGWGVTCIENGMSVAIAPTKKQAINLANAKLLIANYATAIRALKTLPIPDSSY